MSGRSPDTAKFRVSQVTTLSDALAATPATPSAPRRLRRGGGTGDVIFAAFARASGLLVFVLLGAIILSLFIGGLPAFQKFGLNFIFSPVWNPNPDINRYGALVPIYGTIVSSVMALVMAVPIAFGIAFFLTELAPQWLRRPIGIAVELLAAVPSIIYGMWGFFVVAPILQSVQQPLMDAFDDVPVLDTLFGSGITTGRTIFTAGFILAVMIIPFVAATMRDVFLTVPPVFKESAYGVGCTTWEVMRSIVLPYTKTSVVGGIMLGLGRALGETMAVTYVIGSVNRISPGLFAPGNTIAAIIALNFGEAQNGTLIRASLLALGFLLFVISFIVLAISRLLLRPGVRA